jgi:signal transduction histidine kinase
VVLYLQQEPDSLEPSYARAIGRGRSSEADLAWGEKTALEALQTKKAVVRQDVNGDNIKNRMRLRYFLGFPLIAGNQNLGALVFVRYGGPSYQQGQITLAEFIATQITQLLERLKLIKRLSDLEIQLRLERLQDDFVATISHELRTPLGFIKGYATTLLREDTTWDEDTQREFLNIIDEESDRLRELIDNILDSSRLQSGTLRMEFQPLRLDSMLKDVCIKARSFHENLRIDLDIKTKGLQVLADPTRLAQVFDNLLSNAVKYASGSIVLITLKKEENKAQITVQDNGPGIGPEHLKHIFDRFYRVPNASKSVRGTGLGLYICRRLINSHGGEITVKSTIGEGTAFHIYLPLKLANSS